MLALKLLLDQVSSGKINISPDMISRSRNPNQTIEAGSIVVSFDRLIQQRIYIYIYVCVCVCHTANIFVA